MDPELLGRTRWDAQNVGTMIELKQTFNNEAQGLQMW
jgi:hypothetical protein